MKTGMTSSRKLSGGCTVACATFTGSVTVLPARATVRVVAPSAAGWRTAPTRRTSFGSASVYDASFVTSRVMPSAYVAWTRIDWRSRAVVSWISGG